ncbi:MAG TPA: hybrid sensor histidine kinase/response regulator [Kiritimatiellia bacterium]|nr:hybrid sensor histidine kinase/response regulator [Kiritimatiellia bacterium]
MIACAVQSKVLVIDDEVGPRESLRILLKNDYQVFCADSVNRGVEMLREVRPDVVVMDIRMPGKSGIEGLREIRALDPLIAVIMLTGYGALETAQEALRLGASDYIKKPFDTKEMMEIIRTNVRRTALNRKRAGTERDLQELNSRLTSELAKKDRMASLGQASAELVHDLRNPLTVVLGYVQILSEDLQKARQTQSGTFESSSEYISMIERNIERCRALIETWQDLGKANRPPARPLSPANVLREVVDAQRALAAARHADIKLEVSDPAVQIAGDAVQLGRALQNIIGNALDALRPQGGCIVIAAGVHEQGYRIVVRDNGVGIPAENLPYLFEAYFTTKTSNKGTGLGLFITRRIIEDHKGTIAVESRMGEGTEMTIRLPLWSEAQGSS